jgi:LemA protein
MQTKRNWKLPLIILVGVFAVVLMLIFGVQSYQNKAISLEEQVNTAQSDIKVQEKRRVDLVYNLVDCVKNYDKHESETLKAIVDGRSNTSDVEQIATSIQAVAEAYPELKSNENYKQLMNELSITENLIAEYRENYNKQVKTYRKYIKAFPQRVFLNLLGYEKQEFNLLDYNAPETAPQNLFGE